MVFFTGYLAVRIDSEVNVVGRNSNEVSVSSGCPYQTDRRRANVPGFEAAALKSQRRPAPVPTNSLPDQ